MTYFRNSMIQDMALHEGIYIPYGNSKHFYFTIKKYFNSKLWIDDYKTYESKSEFFKKYFGRDKKVHSFTMGGTGRGKSKATEDFINELKNYRWKPKT